ncbi:MULTISPECIES: alpha/beta fold hydrolase [Rhodopseudomonas]|uniref:Alpha/beta hydrolase n=1 Tax=Rhodopseudomonas palustris TaxID=1076 RepID=A0A0D7EK85_RHOPL|nr:MULTISPECIES: alpha/beta fold hydrolase [Rhodopseudomonas]KIZ41066.1 alpha/beta hydrolase [Rhodopseudomonas palustris]MDF3813011.1 alpha/beta fold hydrolase [Rhodopseudomonas sp. BAL398]WOK17556.1 alpha/beta fold hydrolase [Rhodopseudomonas sp. BAL398]
MTDSLPILLVPGLGGSPRIYAPLLPALWRHGPVSVANHIRDDSIAAIAARILAEAPPRFALAGHSMGGYIAFEIMRQAPERVARLALLNTQARPDDDAAKERRGAMIARIQGGGYSDGIASMVAGFVHPSRVDDAELRRVIYAMADDVGPEAFARQLVAIMGRPDSRPTLAQIRCPTLVLSGDQDNTLSNALSVEIAEGISGAKLVIVPECGHLSQIERPAAVTEALLDWLTN